jgi:3-phosphoshikimate 1-carboxyvinyltransferase
VSASLPIEPLGRPADATISLPGSKSITNRALLLAALADGTSRIERALFSDDTRYMAAALEHLGIPVRADEGACLYEVDGQAGQIPSPRADLFVGNAGTAARFLAACVTLGHGSYHLDGVSRMRQRPIGDLVSALNGLGVDASCDMGNGSLPLTIHADGLPGGRAAMRADVSSQFLSAVLLVAPLARGPMALELEGELVSRPYVEMTMKMVEQWGACVRTADFRVFHADGGQKYLSQTYAVEPDASGASYFFAAAAVTGGRVRVDGLGCPSLQGDTAFVDVLERMGCEVRRAEEHIEVRGPSVLSGVDVEMTDISDTVMTLAAIAPFAVGPTHIRGVAHIRHKETDRLRALAAELSRMGQRVEERPDGLTIHPGPLHPCEVETYDDHRMAMSFAIAGLRADGIAIRDPACVGKTFPDFFRRLRLL